MTTTADETVAIDETEVAAQEPETDESAGETETGEPDKDNRDRDFTKVRELHRELADYVNQHSGLEPITPNHVKAVLYLRTDFNNTPEQVTKRQERKAKKEAEAAKYAGLTDDQKKAKKAAERAAEQAQRMAARAAEAQAEADRLLAASNGGDDVAAQVEAAQSETTEGDEPRKRGIGRRR